MSDPRPPAGHAEVTRAVKLLQMRGAGDPVRKVAVEGKIKQLPDHVHAAAKLPDMYRTMCDINHDAAIMIHIRLGIDKDKGEDIATSREKEGLFTSSNDLLTRKLLGSDELKVVEGQIVCY